MVEIAAGPLSVGLAPEVGGSVAHFRLTRDGETIDLMRRSSDADRRAKNPIGAAMFPMVPFANRIADNEFRFVGRTYRFAANNLPERFHVHGTGWQSEWTVVVGGQRSRRLELVRDRPDEPYSYRATQTFALSPIGADRDHHDRELRVETMPFGFGQHPWFEREDDVELRFDAARLLDRGLGQYRIRADRDAAGARRSRTGAVCRRRGATTATARWDGRRRDPVAVAARSASASRPSR